MAGGESRCIHTEMMAGTESRVLTTVALFVCIPLLNLQRQGW